MIQSKIVALLAAVILPLSTTTECDTSSELSEARRELRENLRKESRQVSRDLGTLWRVDINQVTFREHTIFWFTVGTGNDKVGGPVHIPDLCKKCNPDQDLKPEEKVEKVLSEYELMFGEK